MRVPCDWLNEYLSKPIDTRGLAEALERAGIEVEQIEYSVALDAKIVVGVVKKVAQHPRADHLVLTQIAIGPESELAIVCGAPNVTRGMKVAVAVPGAVLPDGTKIKVANLRGVESQGMLCSARELGLGDDHSGIMPLDPALSIGKSLCDIWLATDILDVTTPANRSDLTGLVGLAREVAAQSGRELVLPAGKPAQAEGEAPAAEIEAQELVPRFMAAAVSLAGMASSPAWLQQRLAAAGVRPINVVVDITNFAMLEYGQPLHAFDASKLHLPIVVRTAKNQEMITTLDGVVRKLTERDLVVADQRGPIGLAGVMGGANSEITADTTDIILEAAGFAPAGVRKTALHHGLRTDASARFERGLPVHLPPIALGRALRLLKEIAGAKVAGVCDVRQAGSNEERTIELTARQASRLTGLALTSHEIATQLARLGLTAEAAGDDEVTVRVPWQRPDLQLAEDIIEEVVKLIGYGRIPSTLPVWDPAEVKFDRRHDRLWRLRDRLAGLGHFEVATYSFVSAQQLEVLGYELKHHLKLRNPLSHEQAYLRSDLLPSLLAAASQNQTYAKQFGLFEVSKVFLPQGAGKVPLEPTHLALLVRGGGYAGVKQALDVVGREYALQLEVRPADLPVMHPGRSGEVLLDGDPIGRIGEVDPRVLDEMKLDRVGYLEIDLDRLLAAAGVSRYQSVSKFPPVKRDLTLLSPRAVTWAQVRAAVQQTKLAEVMFVGDYYGAELPDGTKTISIRLIMSDSERTLTVKEAGERLERIVGKLKSELGLSPRS